MLLHAVSRKGTRNRTAPTALLAALGGLAAAATGCASPRLPVPQTAGSAPAGASPSLQALGFGTSAEPAGASAAAGSGPPINVPDAVCAASSLAVDAVPGATAGARYALDISLANTGTMPCSLYGFPSVAGVTGAGVRLDGTDTTESLIGVLAAADAIPSDVVLPPGGKAWLVLVFTGLSTATTDTCPRIASLVVTPPGVERAYSLATAPFGLPFADCAGFAVSPVLSPTQVQAS